MNFPQDQFNNQIEGIVFVESPLTECLVNVFINFQKENQGSVSSALTASPMKFTPIVSKQDDYESQIIRRDRKIQLLEDQLQLRQQPYPTNIQAIIDNSIKMEQMKFDEKSEKVVLICLYCSYDWRALIIITS
jgi:hypothetical protein